MRSLQVEKRSYGIVGLAFYASLAPIFCRQMMPKPVSRLFSLLIGLPQCAHLAWAGLFSYSSTLQSWSPACGSCFLLHVNKMEFDLKTGSQGHIYLPKKIREILGDQMSLLPNSTAVALFGGTAISVMFCML